MEFVVDTMAVTSPPPFPSDNSGSTAAGLLAARSGVRMPKGPKYFSLLQNVQTGNGAHPASYSFFFCGGQSDILRRNCLLKQVIEGKIKGEMEVTRRRGRRRKKLLDDLKDRRGYSHLKVEALDRTMWRHRFGGGFGPVVRQITE